jgi:hypothetical protein
MVTTRTTLCCAVVLLAASVGLVGCTGPKDGDRIGVQTDPGGPTTCEQAWLTFAAIGRRALAEDLRPTLFACPSVHKWIAVGTGTRDVGMHLDRRTAMNLCQPGTLSGVAVSPVCESL